MMIAVDIETQGLDATKFLCGTITRPDTGSTVYYSKEKMWNAILLLGERERKRQKVLSVYAHNHRFDFYGYAPLDDKNIKIYNENPFIVAYMDDEKKEYIKFLDSWSLFRMPLAKLGEIIGLPKLETPEIFLNEERKPTLREMRDVEEYVKRDAEIVLAAMGMLKEKLKEDGIHMKRLYTESQVAINYVIRMLQGLDDSYTEGLWFNKDRGWLIRNRHASLIHEAYRGGRVEAKPGVFENVVQIDINSLYPHIAKVMRFPNLKTERYIAKPLKLYKIKDLLNVIGVSRALVYNRSNDIGILPVRTGSGNYFPGTNSYLVGTWTNAELKKAMNDGYEIIHIEWSVLWDEAENPYSQIIPVLYRRRLNADDSFNKDFYKTVMNKSFGKLGQTRHEQEIVIDSIEEAEKYISENWEMVRGIGTDVMYRKEKKGREKNYYCPILPTLINAEARLRLYDDLAKLTIAGFELLYCDTDGIIINDPEHKTISSFKQTGIVMLSPTLGDYKIEKEKGKCIIYGRKTYAIGDHVKVAGIRMRDATIDDFAKGEVKGKRMMTLQTSAKLEDVGKFVTETRDLVEQLQNYEKVIELFKKQRFFKDKTITTITEFIPFIETAVEEMESGMDTEDNGT